MTCFKKLWALLLAAGMALTLFAGCCSPSLLRLLLDLLQDQYQNITVTAEDDLETALRQAVSQNDSMEEITAALAQALDKTVEFQSLRSARAGDQTFSLVFQTGNDTEAIARQTYTDWNKVLGSLPSSGQYLADLATLKADGGYYILVNVTVKRGGSSGSSGDGSGSGDENDGGGTTNPQKDYEWIGTDVILVHTNTGLQNVFFDDMSGSDQPLMDARAAGFKGTTIKLEKSDYVVNQTFEPDFKGVLTSANTSNVATIQLSDHSMFELIGSDGNVGDPENKVSYINFIVTGKITSGITNMGRIWVGAVASQNSGVISHCNVTFEDGGGIEVTSGDTEICVGGIAGNNFLGTIEYCTVESGFIQVNVQRSELGLVYVGGVAGNSMWFATIENCGAFKNEITVNIPEDIKLTFKDRLVTVGGVAGYLTERGTSLEASDNEITVNCGNQIFTLQKPLDMNYCITIGNEVGVTSSGV